MASVGDLAQKYSSQLKQLHVIFPSWDESDLVFTLQDSRGNVEEAVLAISEGRASQFTQATKKKPTKPVPNPAVKSHGNRNADSAGLENASGEGFAGRGGRGGARGGRGGTRGGRGGEPFRGSRGGRGGARGGRGGYGNVNGGANGAKKTDANESATEGWPTTTATTAEGWTNQVEQAESAAADDELLAGEPAQSKVPGPSQSDDFSAAGGFGDAPAPKEIEAAAKSGTTAWQTESQKPVPVAKSTVPPVKPKMTWAQIAKPAEKPKTVPPPVPKAPEPKPEADIMSKEPAVQEPEPASEPVEEEKVEAPAPVEADVEAVTSEEAVQEESYTNGQAEEASSSEDVAPAPTLTQEAWAADPAIVGSAPVAKTSVPAPEPVTTYTGPPGFNTIAAKAIPQPQQPRTNSRAAQRYKNVDGQAVVLPASASGVSSVEMQFGSLSFGGLDGDGVEAPVLSEAPAQPEVTPAVVSPVRAPQPPIASQLPVAPQPPIAHQPPVAPLQTAPPPVQVAPIQASSTYYNQQAAPQQPTGFPPSQTLQQQMQSYQSHYGQQQPAQPQPEHTSQPQQQYYRQQDYYNPVGSQSHQQQQPEPQQQQATTAQQQHQPQQQHSYDSAPFGGFSNQAHLFNQPTVQQNEYGQGRAFDSYSSSAYPRPPVEEAKQTASAPSHTPTAPAQPQQTLPHQQNQYYSNLGNMGYYHSGPYNPYYQYGQAPNPGFQQYYPMAGRNVYGQPAPQAPPAPIPTNKPNATSTHQSPYGATPPTYQSTGYDEQSFGLGRYSDSTKAAAGAPQPGASTQVQQTQQPIGLSAGSLPQSYQSQQGLHNYLGGMNAPAASSAPNATQPSRPQAATPDDNFKNQASPAGVTAAATVSATGVNRAQPVQPQATQQAFASYPYGGGYQNQDWSPYGQQHYSGSRNGGYTGWQQ